VAVSFLRFEKPAGIRSGITICAGGTSITVTVMLTGQRPAVLDGRSSETPWSGRPGEDQGSGFSVQGSGVQRDIQHVRRTHLCLPEPVPR